MKRTPIQGIVGVLVAWLVASTGTGCEVITAISDSEINDDAGGAGGCAACATAASCQAPAGECLEATCDQQCCGVHNRAAGSTCSAGVCDGQGACVGCITADQCAAQKTLCKLNTCDAHACGASNARIGARCSDHGGRVCDGAGACVECNTGDDCSTTACHPIAKVCVAPTCADSMKDANETDVDCGGSDVGCPPCAAFKGCKTSGDCASGGCDLDSHTCL